MMLQRPRRPALSVSAALMMLVATGCVAPESQGPGPAADAGAETASEASLFPFLDADKPEKEGSIPFISRIETREATRGSQVILHGAGPIEYQVFPLKSPPRLLFTFPSARVDDAIQPRTLSMTTIKSITPFLAADGSSRLEVMLAEPAEYDIQPLKEGLAITVLAMEGTQTEGPARMEEALISQNDQGTTIRLVGQGSAKRFQSYRLNNPDRLVVDVFDIEGPAKPRRIDADTAEVASLDIAAHDNRLRLSARLTGPRVSFRVDDSGPLPVIHLSGTQIVLDEGYPVIQSVDFKRDGAASLVDIALDRSDAVVDLTRDQNSLIVDLIGTGLPEALVRRMDVAAFGGAVTAIDAYERENQGARIAIRLNDPQAAHEMLQRNNSVQIKVTDPSLARADGEKLPYTGEKVTLDFHEIDIKNAIRFIAEVSGHNIILSNTVTGDISLRLVDVPWDQALDLILETRNLGKVKEGNIIRVAPLTELQSMAQARLQAEQSNRQLEPLITRMVPVNFAEASQIKTLLESGDQAQGTRLLSTRGVVSIDARTNTLIIQDTAARQSRIQELISKIDTPIPQVMIEVRIVEVSRNTNYDFGIHWGASHLPGGNPTWAVSDTAANAYLAMTNAASVQGSAPRALVTGTTTQPKTVQLGSVGGSSGFNIGLAMGALSPLIDLNIELNALETSSLGKTISSPKVLTTNNTAARITQGEQIPYSTVSDSGTQTTFVEAALTLDVTPQITPDRFITLDVEASNNSVGSYNSSASILPINTREVKTQVLVKDGETVVLGGIFKNETTDSNSAVPGLSQLPLVGWLFQSESTITQQTELLIFITPRVVNAS